jgi:hypothetical protein
MENSISRRKTLGMLCAGLAMPALIGRASAATTPVLVELFTSQGCSSCPPADKLAGELMGQPNVTVVSLNVDYWDYLGWKDTLAKPEYTKRQMDYAHSRGDMSVYTPQMIINGAAHVVGSNGGSVRSAIAEAKSALALNISATESDIKIDLPKGEAENATLWLMSIASSVNVKIERGENIGKAITYRNVARKLLKVAKWNGAAASIIVPRKEMISSEGHSLIAVLQEGDVGPVMGLGKLDVA